MSIGDHSKRLYVGNGCFKGHRVLISRIASQSSTGQYVQLIHYPQSKNIT